MHVVVKVNGKESFAKGPFDTWNDAYEWTEEGNNVLILGSDWYILEVI